MTTRKYTQRKRAEQQEETRRRIVEATMRLHEEVGAARTTISAVAREAGVQRLTVYRHFPDEADLLLACTSTWLEQHPLPGPADWSGAEDPVRAALTGFYRYYRRTEAMWESSYRDVDVVEALAEQMQKVERYLESLAAELAGEVDGDAGEEVRMVLLHGLQFSTWRSLTRAGADDGTAAALLADFVQCIAGGGD